MKNLLGAHQSIAGGLHLAIQRAKERECDCVQIFTKSTNQWRARALAAGEIEQFRQAVTQLGVACPLAHNSYLVNLASPQPDLWRRSVDAMVQELLRAEALGIPWVVAHPGAATDGDEAGGLRRVAVGLDEIFAQTRGLAVGCLLETTAGQGTALGWRFEHLATLLAGVTEPDRLGVCFDTCHVFAAGYALQTAAEYRATMKQFDRIVGVKQIRGFHLNDSLRGCGGRIDRHAHLGRGEMGLEPFRCLLRDRRFRSVPMILETPKGRDEELDLDLDVRNLRALRSL
jgi:deoxyribonuclease-4